MIFGLFRRLRELEAQVTKHEKNLQDLASLVEDLDPAELIRLRQSVLNALRSLSRTQQAAAERENKAQGDAAPPGARRTHPWLQGGA